MADRYLSQKFDVNSFGGIRESGFYGRMDDGRQRTTDAHAMIVTKENTILLNIILSPDIYV